MASAVRKNTKQCDIQRTKQRKCLIDQLVEPAGKSSKMWNEN